MVDIQFVGDDPAPTASLEIVHVVEDGLTAGGRVWYRGQELQFSRNSEQFRATQDRMGVSWLDYDDREQMRRWGRVMFRPGAWPGRAYADAKAADAERRRARALPTPPVVPSS